MDSQQLQQLIPLLIPIILLVSTFGPILYFVIGRQDE